MTRAADCGKEKRRWCEPVQAFATRRCAQPRDRRACGELLRCRTRLWMPRLRRCFWVARSSSRRGLTRVHAGRGANRAAARLRCESAEACANRGVTCRFRNVSRVPARSSRAMRSRRSQPAHAQVAMHAQKKAAPPSLLSRLLATEIRRERSHLLQAFRFLSQSGCAPHTALHAMRSHDARAPDCCARTGAEISEASSASARALPHGLCSRIEW
jgi:hypothetical protein